MANVGPVPHAEAKAIRVPSTRYRARNSIKTTKPHL